jgi:hypothetical protein
MKLLKSDKEESVKIGAIFGLASMGTNAKGAVPELRSLAKDKKSKLGNAAKKALKAINQKQ